MIQLEHLRVRPVAQWLAPPSDPTSMLRAAVDEPGLAGLVGVWAGGGALITADPLITAAEDNPIDALRTQPTLTAPAPADFVGGGWFGWLAYTGPSSVAFYDHVLRLRADGWYFEALVSDQRDALLQARLEEYEVLLDLGARSAAGWDAGDFTGAGAEPHLDAVERAIEAIRAGDVYQANVCTRLSASFRGSAVELFAAAVRDLAPDYAAYLAGSDEVVASLSPELLVRRRGRDVVSSPIKGTAPQTAAGHAQLSGSAKDAAENVMIVDLVRNDLGSVAATGSVTVPELLSVQPHTGVWQLVSSVAGRVREDTTDSDLLRAVFPPGSVTGAPKSSALRLIAEVESSPRGVYTGAIGFASPVWGAEFSVAIRTFEISGGRIELGVGGGVTADSVPMLEWRECLDKARPLLGSIGARLATESPAAQPTSAQLAGGVLETMLAVDGVVLRVSDHLARLDRSCRELYGAPMPAGIAAEVTAAAAAQVGRCVLRVIVVPVGRTLRATVTRATTGARPASSDAVLVARPAGLWRHKWADRQALTADEAAYDTPLYVAADGTVLETSRGNVVLIDADGGLVTPPLRDDLLPGVTRRAVLDLARDDGRPHRIRSFAVDELMAHAAFWTSSVSLAVPIHHVDSVALPRHDGLVAEFAERLSHGGSVTR